MRALISALLLTLAASPAVAKDKKPKKPSKEQGGPMHCVEPDGTTGSYILFDKTTLQPLAVVNQAGQQINISNGVLSQSSTPLSPDVEKLIQDVFTLKFSANDTNPKTTTAQTDTTNPLLYGPPIKLANGTTATPVYQQTALLTGNTPTSTMALDALQRRTWPTTWSMVMRTPASRAKK